MGHMVESSQEFDEDPIQLNEEMHQDSSYEERKVIEVRVEKLLKESKKIKTFLAT